MQILSAVAAVSVISAQLTAERHAVGARTQPTRQSKQAEHILTGSRSNFQTGAERTKVANLN